MALSCGVSVINRKSINIHRGSMHQLKLEGSSSSRFKEELNDKTGEREFKTSISLQEEEAECMRQIGMLYGRYLDEFNKTQKLKNERREMELGKLRLIGSEGSSNCGGKRAVCKLKEELSKKQGQLGDIKREVINNSAKIRQIVKDIGELKGQIIIQECEFERLKSKKQAQEQVCLEKENSIVHLNNEIKQQTLRKVSLLKQLHSLRVRTIDNPSLAALQHQIAKMQSCNQQMRETAYQLGCL